MTRIFSKIILVSLIFLPCLVLLSCRSTSPLVHPDAAETNRRAPDVFDVCLETSKGKISIEVHRDWSPHGADRFYNLVRACYYDDTRFFRVIQGRWAQFGINGDPKISNAWRARTIADDPKVESNARGTVAYAFSVPNGRTTQVFINLKDNRRRMMPSSCPLEKLSKAWKWPTRSMPNTANQPAVAFAAGSKVRFLKRAIRICRSISQSLITSFGQRLLTSRAARRPGATPGDRTRSAHKNRAGITSSSTSRRWCR